MHRVQAGPLVGFAGVLVLLSALEVAPGVGTAGWAVGATCGAMLTGLLARALLRRSRGEGRQEEGLGPADRVTLLRGVLVCGVAALAAGPRGSGSVATLVVLASTALVLDGVDGRVARRTGTVSVLGARFDLEVDAFLILVLSAYVAPRAGAWVLLIGAARYLFVAARWFLPWLRGSVPPRPWCKVVAVVQGVVLTVAASGFLPLALSRLALAVALVLLTESFGREVRDLWCARPASGTPSGEPLVRELVDRA